MRHHTPPNGLASPSLCIQNVRSHSVLFRPSSVEVQPEYDPLLDYHRTICGKYDNGHSSDRICLYACRVSFLYTVINCVPSRSLWQRPRLQAPATGDRLMAWTGGLVRWSDFVCMPSMLAIAAILTLVQVLFDLVPRSRSGRVPPPPATERSCGTSVH